MRKKKMFKMGVYAYVALLFAGASYALFRGVPVEFAGRVTAFDARPPDIVTPGALVPGSPGATFPTTSPGAVVVTTPPSLLVVVTEGVPQTQLLIVNQKK